MLPRTLQPADKASAENNDDGSLLFPILPGADIDTMHTILYFILLDLINEPSREKLGILRLISKAWENYITQPPAPDLDLGELIRGRVKVQTLEHMRLKALHSVKLSVLPDPSRLYFAVYFNFNHGLQPQKVSECGHMDRKIKLFANKEHAEKFAETNAGEMFEYTGQKLTVSPAKFVRPRKLRSCGVVTLSDARSAVFFKADNAFDMRTPSPQEGKIEDRPLRKMSCRKVGI